MRRPVDRYSCHDWRIGNFCCIIGDQGGSGRKQLVLHCSLSRDGTAIIVFGSLDEVEQ